MNTEITNPDRLRQAFRAFNRLMLLWWRLGLGSFMNRRELSGQIMVLAHTGRRSGVRYRTPVNYAILDGDVFCTAGFGPRSDWYQNILADPRVEVWLPDGWWAGEAEDVSAYPYRQKWLREVLIASGFAARAAGIDPLRMSDEQLQAATEEYRLVRIKRIEARTGPGGPGDLAWVWPLATLILSMVLLTRRRKS